MFDLVSVKFWQGVCIVLGIGILGLGVTVGIMQLKNNSLKDDLNETKTTLLYLQNSLKQNAIAYQGEIKKYNEKVIEASKIQKVKLVQIRNFKGEKNASDCSNANTLLGNYIF